MKKILMLEHVERPGVFNFKRDEEPVVSNDIADYLISRNTARLLQLIPDPVVEEPVVEEEASTPVLEIHAAIPDEKPVVVKFASSTKPRKRAKKEDVDDSEL